MKRLVAFISMILLLLPFVAEAFSVSPAIIELSGNRGASVTSQVMVKNTATAEKTFYLEVIKFAASQDSGAPVFISPSIDRTGLPQWIALSQTRVSVKAGAQATIPFTVAVPADVPSGSYNAAILISDSPFDVVSSQGSALQARTAVLVLFTVNGQTVSKAALLDFAVSRATDDWSENVAYRYRIQNQGNVFLTPKGTVTLTDLFGRTLAQGDANALHGRVLPGMTRTYDGQLQSSLFAIGPVTATFKLSYADGAAPLTATSTFWVMPKTVLFVVVGLLGLLVVLLLARRFKRSS